MGTLDSLKRKYVERRDDVNERVTDNRGGEMRMKRWMERREKTQIKSIKNEENKEETGERKGEDGIKNRKKIKEG